MKTTAREEGLVTVADVARRLRMRPHDIWNEVEAGRLPGPSHPRGKRLYYLPAEVDQLENQVERDGVRERRAGKRRMYPNQ